jgi:2,5-dioxopentanoate dehydrogenase
MLTPGIHRAFRQGVAALEAHDVVERVAAAVPSEAPNRGAGAVFAASGKAFAANPALAAEVFGASSLVVRCRDLAEMQSVIAGLEGQLTASIHLDAEDQADAASIVPLLVAKSGRVLANGWPTGVEVTRAMVHGGPYPATSDARTTSVGTLAMTRFLRPVCWQDIPDPLLPPALQRSNPWDVPRRVDARWEGGR